MAAPHSHPGEQQVLLRLPCGATRVARLPRVDGEGGGGVLVRDVRSLARSLCGGGGSLRLRLLARGRQLAAEGEGEREGGAPVAAVCAPFAPGARVLRCVAREDVHVHVRHVGCVGGKGGFGSLLRASGRKSEVSNKDACRDLGGRRLRHVNAARTLEQWERGREAREAQRRADDTAKRAAKRGARDARREADERAARHELESAARKATSATAAAVSAGMQAALERKRKDPGAAAGPSSERGAGRPAKARRGAAGGAPGRGLDAWGLLGDAGDMSDVSESGDEADAEDEQEARGGGESDGGSGRGSGGSGAMAAGQQQDAPAEAAEAAQAVAPLPLPSAAERPAEPADAPSAAAAPLDLAPYASAEALLEAEGAERIKAELARLGLKCGGAPAQRAERLFLLKDTPLGQLAPEHFAGAKGKKRAKGKAKVH